MSEKNRLNQSVLAKAAGVQRTQLCEILKGRRRMSINCAKALSKVTGIEPGVLCFAAPGDLIQMLWENRERWEK